MRPLRHPFLSLFLFLAALATAQNGLAQTTPVKPEEFSTEPLAALPDSLKSYPAVFEFHRMILVGERTKIANGLEKTTHRRVRINNETGLNQFKTIELSPDNGDNYLSIKVKVFSPDGKSRELDLKNMRKVKADEGNSMVFKLPIDGLEIGGAYEIILVEDHGNTENQTLTLQWGYPVLKNFVSLRIPKVLVYEAKAYNVPAEIKEEPLNDGEGMLYTVTTGLVMPMKEESFMDYGALHGRVDFTIRRVTTSGFVLNWNSISNQLIGELLPADAADRKAILKLLKKIGADKKTPMEQVSMFEVYLKKNVYIHEGYRTTPFQQVIEKDHEAYEFGLLKFYVNLIDHLGLNYRIGGTCDRNQRRFDTEFASYSNLRTWFVYLPDTKQYLFPGSATFLLGNTYGPSIGQKAILIKPLTVNGAIGVKVSMDSVPVPDTAGNIHNTYARMKVNLADHAITATVKNVYKGSLAQNLRGYFETLSAKELEEQVKGMFLPKGADGGISNVKLENVAFDGSQPGLPLVQNFDAKMNNSAEVVGDEILLNVGWIIGNQVSLPKEEHRRYPVNPGEPKVYNRDVVLEIPEGYKVATLNGLDQSIKYQNGGIQFLLTVKQEANTVHIVNKEYYRVAIMPASAYPQYEEVMNAASILNNMKIILKKA